METLSRLILNTVKSYPKDNLMLSKHDGRWLPLSTAEVGERIKALALGLKELGVAKSDKIIILSENRPEWHMTDFATLCLGGVTVPVYTSLMPDQIRYIIDDSDAKVVVCSGLALWGRLAAVKGALAKVRHFIVMDGPAPEGALAMGDVIEKGRAVAALQPRLFEELALGVKPDDLASIIYTSGTTGVPKGVMLTHGNFASNVRP